MSEITKAPWTAEQCVLLNRRQANNSLHPYTCGGCSPSNTLVAVPEGWRCSRCDYQQDWAHAADVAGVDDPSAELAALAPAEQGVPDGIKINQMRAPSHRRDGQFYVTRNDGMYLSTDGTWMLSCIDGWFKTREEAAATLRAALAAKPAPPANAVQRVVSAAKAYVACAATGQDPTTEYDELRAAVAALEER